MRKNTDKHHGLVGGIVVTALVVLFVLLVLTVLFQVLGPALPFLGELGAALGIVLFYAAVLLAVAVGVVAALIQRWREVREGEEDEAKKY